MTKEDVVAKELAKIQTIQVQAIMDALNACYDKGFSDANAACHAKLLEMTEKCASDLQAVADSRAKPKL